MIAVLKTRVLVELAAGGRAVLPERDTDHASSPGHVAWMLVQCIHFRRTLKGEKAHRWLGFVQGCLLAHRHATLDELKLANMPEGEAFDAGKI